MDAADFLVLGCVTLAVAMGRLLGNESRLLLSCVVVAVLSGSPYVLAAWLIIYLVISGLSMVRELLK